MVSEIVSCVGWKTMQVQPGKITQLLRILVYEFQIKNIVQQGYEYLLLV